MLYSFCHPWGQNNPSSRVGNQTPPRRHLDCQEPPTSWDEACFPLVALVIILHRGLLCHHTFHPEKQTFPQMPREQPHRQHWLPASSRDHIQPIADDWQQPRGLIGPIRVHGNENVSSVRPTGRDSGGGASALRRPQLQPRNLRLQHCVLD